MKEINLNDSIFEICSKYHEVKDIMKSLGFENIVNPVMLNSVGRKMTIPKGAIMKDIKMEDIKVAFEREGFTLI